MIDAYLQYKYSIMERKVSETNSQMGSGGLEDITDDAERAKSIKNRQKSEGVK